MNRTEQLHSLKLDVDALASAEESTLLASLPQWDSLAVLLIIAHFEHVHNKSITGAQIRACHSVSDLLDLIST